MARKLDGGLIGTLMFVVTAALSGGCATQMTVTQFVNNRLMSADPGGLKALVDAANAAQSALNLKADTPIMEIRKHPEKLQALVNQARDAYRHSRSYQIQGSSTVPTEGVELTDLNAPNANRVMIPGNDIVFRVNATQSQVVVLGLESSRGLPIVSFDQGMTPTIAPRFRKYMVGDHISVTGDVVDTIERADPDSNEPPGS